MHLPNVFTWAEMKMIVLSSSEKAQIAKAVWHRSQNCQKVMASGRLGARNLEDIRQCYLRKRVRQRDGCKPDPAIVEAALNQYFDTMLIS